jgi:hypothetical protein
MEGDDTHCFDLSFWIDVSELFLVGVLLVKMYFGMHFTLLQVNPLPDSFKYNFFS